MSVAAKERRLSSRSNSGESEDKIGAAELGRRKRATSVSESISVLRTSKRTIYTAGRPPWYNEFGQMKEAFVIGLSGGSASGKTTVAEKIIQALDFPWVVLLSMDSFYKANIAPPYDQIPFPQQHELAERNEYNFDHVDAFDFDLCCETLRKLKQGRNVEIPMYDFTSHCRKKQAKPLYGANVVIFEGIMSFVRPELRALMDMKVFVDTDSDERLARRLRRDITQRGRNLKCGGGSNEVAIDLIAQHVQTQLETVSYLLADRFTGFYKSFCYVYFPISYCNKQFLYSEKCIFFLIRRDMSHIHNGQPLPSTLNVLESTKQVQGIHTILRNRETPRDDFVFFSKRLMRLLFEFALSLLPHKIHVVETPQETQYEGRKFSGTGLCGMSILRAGETMEPALFSVTKDIRLGKILIQTNAATEEPELHYIRVPRKISEDHVILMDATVATGAAAMMAIRVLLDHDVKEENILLVSLLMADTGVHSVAYAFPKVQIVTTAVDHQLNDRYHILPGFGEYRLGNFGDRYFGTE
uniref:uridine/cytidine kinase n=1 Tax=Ciona savignyi TaxID=51511 RepID=H2Z968_CIOSA